MGRGKSYDYRKGLREFADSRIRERYLYAERITAVYGEGPTSTGEWTPAVDVYETPEALVLVAEVAGLSREEIRLEVSGKNLTLRGFRPFARTGIAPENYYRMEFSYGNFERSFTLPVPVREEDVKASLRGGVLTVTVPLSPERETRKIKIDREREGGERR